MRDRRPPHAPSDGLEPQFIPLVPPRRGRRRLWLGLGGLALFALLLGAVYVGITWAASDPGAGHNAAGAAPTSSPARTSPKAAGPKHRAPHRAARSTAKPMRPKARPRTTAAKPAARSATSTQPPLSSPAEPAIAPSGVRYAFPAAHFAARFPYRPQTTGAISTEGDVTYTFHTVACFELHIGVESLDASRPPTAAGRTPLLRTAARHLVGGGAASNERAVTYRQRPAWRMDVATGPGTTLSVVSVIDRNGRVFTLMAPSGAAFNALTASFAAVS